MPVVATNPTLVSGRANDSEGLAYDWVNKNLYWVNTMEPASIDVTSNNGQFPSAKVVKNLDKPRGLAVDPREVYVISLERFCYFLSSFSVLSDGFFIFFFYFIFYASCQTHKA